MPSWFSNKFYLIVRINKLTRLSDCGRVKRIYWLSRVSRLSKWARSSLWLSLSGRSQDSRDSPGYSWLSKIIMSVRISVRQTRRCFASLLLSHSRECPGALKPLAFRLCTGIRETREDLDLGRGKRLMNFRGAYKEFPSLWGWNSWVSRMRGVPP